MDKLWYVLTMEYIVYISVHEDTTGKGKAISNSYKNNVEQEKVTKKNPDNVYEVQKEENNSIQGFIIGNKTMKENKIEITVTQEQQLLLRGGRGCNG